ncbi:hypothetical protein Q8F57_012315 [Paraburkholderia terrae]|uniref:hypothetical protein n=1 Tax=Paraburkholderia terrae TaxID=311230 RepID=UPI00296AD59D|nr:hypothetical protein [Paraburkholderia terrae]MDW3659030.1 hypothetical protein [Paraburkholderia terrae]
MDKYFHLVRFRRPGININVDNNKVECGVFAGALVTQSASSIDGSIAFAAFGVQPMAAVRWMKCKCVDDPSPVWVIGGSLA